MAFRYIIGCYAVSAGCIITVNKITYQPQNAITGSMCNLLKLDTSYGKTFAGVSFVLSPFFIPGFGGSLLIVSVADYVHNKLDRHD